MFNQPHNPRCGDLIFVGTQVSSTGPTPGINLTLPPTRVPGSLILTPTPDAPHPLPVARTVEEEYVIQSGDTLGKVAQAYSINLQELIEANGITNPNLVEVGQAVQIPVPSPQPEGPGFKIIPDFGSGL